MVSDCLFLTNHHVITSAADCPRFVLEFDFQLDYRGQPRAVTRFALAPELFFLTSPETDLDFTLVAVGRRTDGGAQLETYGYVPLLARGDKHILGELVNVVQHPEGNFKQAVIRQNQLVARLDRVLHYVADTMPGSSGSPVFNDQWEAIALHHWGEPFTETVGPKGKPLSHDVNEGIRISAILTKLDEMRAQLADNNMRALLDAVRQPTAQYPSKLSEVITRTSASSDEGAALDKDGIKVRVDPDGRATWTLPLQVTVQLGNFSTAASVVSALAAAPAAPAAAGSIPAEAEKIAVDPNYSNRTGYDPKFLAGFTVPMPVLSAAQKKRPQN